MSQRQNIILTFPFKSNPQNLLILTIQKKHPRPYNKSVDDTNPDTGTSKIL